MALLSLRNPERRSEAIWSLALAAISLGFLLCLAGVVVLWDLKSFQERVERFLEISLDAPDLAVSETQYARNAARSKSEKLIRGSKTGIFSALPGHPQEAPQVDQVRAPVPVATPRDLPEHGPENPLFRSPAFAKDERKARREATRNNLPVLAVKRVGNGAAIAVPDLAKVYPNGRVARSTLGVPGDTILTPDAPSMPDAPSLHTLQPPLPGATQFLREEQASAVSRRLVQQRPAKGYPSLDTDIAARFDVYRKPGATDAYFRLELSLQPESRVRTIAKDVLFLVDISQSISRPELYQVREAIADYLATLHRGDRWNVILFSEEVHQFDENAMFLPARQFNREDVIEFIDRRPKERRTDVFLATQLVMARVPPSNRPCNVFLLSDGKATEGTSDINRIVHDFQRVNRDNFSIFTFNAGPNGNLYLLRLLSYRSRGQLVDCPETMRVPEAMRSFFTQFEKPVLTNVVANYTNLRTEEVYPKVLPNLYRDASIVFLGRTIPGQNVALRIAGLTEKGPREFFFRTAVPVGDESNPDIMRQWARGKAHALIAALADNPKNETLRTEILQLAQTHHLNEITQLVERKGFFDFLRRKK